MEKTSKVVLATATVLLSVNAMTFGQSATVKVTPQVQTTKVSSAVKAQVQTNVNSSSVQSKESHVKGPDTHSQSGGHSKFSKPADIKNNKVNVKAAAAKAKAKIN
jgi:hypothetical protein